ncbi:glycosyltransferase family 2 protein [Stappia sp.]|uniref:glycosyltransferase family 2 protein n=1 Tax=Stappia sp. TaxID=1870903 RepID=UPI003D0CD8E9
MQPVRGAARHRVTLPPEIALLGRRGVPVALLHGLAGRAGGSPVRLARLAVERGLVSAEAYYCALAESLDLPFLPEGAFHADFSARFPLPPGVAGPVFCGRNALGERVVVLAPLPETVPAIRALLRRAPDLARRLRIATPAAIAGAARAADPALRLAVEKPALSARRRLTPQQVAVGTALLAALAAGHFLSLKMMGVALSVAVTVLGMLPGAVRALAGVSRPRARSPARLLSGVELPAYTVLVPLYRETRVARSLVTHLAAFDYPQGRLEILFLLEEDDAETAAALAPELLPHMRILTVRGAGPRTKPRALTHGLEQARGEIVAVYDGEDRPEPDQLRLAASLFAELPVGVAALQAHLAIDHRSARFFPRQFLLEYSGLFDCLLPWMAARGWPFPLGGTSNHFRRAALVAVGGWDPYNVTEDADLAIRLCRAGHRLEMLASTTFEEAPLTWRAWHGQRTRWLKGWLQTLLVTLRDPFALAGEMRRTRLAVLLVYLLGMVVTLAAHPVFVAILLLYGSGLADLQFYADALTGVTFTLAGVSVVLCYASMTLLAIGGSAARNRLPALHDLLLIPVYWLAQSLAFYAAVIDLVRQPHNWSKTEHGLARRPRRAPGSR